MMKKPDVLVPIFHTMVVFGYAIAGAVYRDVPWFLSLALATMVILTAMYAWLAHVRANLAYEQGRLIEAQSELLGLLNGEIELLKGGRQA